MQDCLNLVYILWLEVLFIACVRRIYCDTTSREFFDQPTVIRPTAESIDFAVEMKRMLLGSRIPRRPAPASIWRGPPAHQAQTMEHQLFVHIPRWCCVCRLASADYQTASEHFSSRKLQMVILIWSIKYCQKCVVKCKHKIN